MEGGGCRVEGHPATPSKEGDNPTQPELNRVHSTARETSPYGNPDPGPLNQTHQVKKPKKSSSKEGEDTEDTGSGLAESALGVGQG